MRILRHPAFRWLVTIILFGLLGFQLWTRSQHFASLSMISFEKSSWWFFAVILLMPVNWILETLKWKTLLTLHVKVSFFQMIRAVAGGVALSIFTPNRIGEYGGRIMIMPSYAKWQVATSTLMGSLAQNLVAFSAGIVACLFLFKGIFLFTIFGIMMIGLASLCFFNIRRVLQILSDLNIHSVFKKVVVNLQHMDDYSHKRLWRVLSLALARYVVYTTQFVLILHAFEPGIGAEILFPGVSAIFLFQTLVPLPPVADVMARANIGLILWSGTGMGELSISLASLMIWLFNLLIPAMIGSFAIGTTAPLISLDTHESILPSDYVPAAPGQPDLT